MKYLKNCVYYFLANFAFVLLNFIPYFVASQCGYDGGPGWCIYGALQMVIGYVIFRFLPLKNAYKFSTKEMRIQVGLFFLLTVLLSLIAAVSYSSWFSFMFINATYPFVFWPSFVFYLVVYIVEDAVKTIALYRNMLHKEQQKPNVPFLAILAAVDIALLICAIYVAVEWA